MYIIIYGLLFRKKYCIIFLAKGGLKWKLKLIKILASDVVLSATAPFSVLVKDPSFLKASAKFVEVAEGDKATCQDAVDGCPVSAITVEE